MIKRVHRTLRSHAVRSHADYAMYTRAVFDLLSTKPLYSVQRVFIDALLTLS